MRILIALLFAASAVAQQGTPLQSPVTARRFGSNPGQLCTEHTDASLECVKGAADGWLPLTNNTMDLGATGTRFRDGWFSRDLSVAGSLGVNNLVISGSCTGPGCSVWTRNSGSGYLYPLTTTDDVRVKNKLQFEDNSGGGSGLVFDAQATITLATPGTRYLEFRDNAGAYLLRLMRQNLGSVVDEAVFDLSLMPSANNTRTVGKSGVAFSHGWMNTVHTNVLDGPSGFVQVNDDLLAGSGLLDVGDIATPFDNGHFNNIFATLGSSGSRVPKLWVTDIDCSGTCPAGYFTRNGGGGYVHPTTTTDDIRAKNKIQWEDNSGGASGLIFDSQVTITTASPGTRYLEFRDNAGDYLLRLARQNLGAVVDEATFDLSIMPKTNAARTVGKSGLAFSHGWLNTLHSNVITGSAGFVEFQADITAGSATIDIGDVATPIDNFYVNNIFADGMTANAVRTTLLGSTGGPNISLDGHFVPTDNTYDFGGSSNRMRKLFAYDADFADDVIVTGDLNVGGTCTGCGSSLFTDGGATTYLTATGDNLAIGGTSTAYKFDVFGSARIQSSLDVDGNVSMASTYLLCATDGGCYMGDPINENKRFADIRLTTAMYIYNGVSSTLRVTLSNGGLTLRNSGGTQTATFVSASGNIVSSGSADFTGGFKVAGTSGISTTTTAGCVFTLGILTTGC